MPLLGRAALVVALGLLVYALLAGALRRLPRAAGACSSRPATRSSPRSSRRSSPPLVLLTALLAHDFSFAYVADHTSRELPLRFSFTALLGRPGGLAAPLAARAHGDGRRGAAAEPAAHLRRAPVDGPDPRRRRDLLRARCSSSSRARSRRRPPPVDGAGLNPSLQNPYMIAHPPLLYLGYVGLTIPFAFAMARSPRSASTSGGSSRRAAGRSPPGRSSASRILLGAKWAYEEVGWGGWYAWDPVENAALMPWLVATAFLHSVMVQEKKNMLRVWNVVLVARRLRASRSSARSSRGAGSSARSTASPSRRSAPGSSASSRVVAPPRSRSSSARLPLLRSRTRLESLVSREAAFLYNNLFLVAFALTCSGASLYPLVSEAVRGVAVTVGRAVLQLLRASRSGCRSSCSWASGRSSRGGGPRSARSRAASPGRPASRSRPGVVLLALGAGSSPPGLVGYTFARVRASRRSCSSSPAGRARARRSATTTWLGAFTSLVGRNRRRYGGYIVHAAIVLLLDRRGRDRRLRDHARGASSRPGETMRVGGYTLTLPRLDASSAGANAIELRARLAVVARRRAARDDRGREEPLPRRAADLERGRDPHRLAARRGPVRDRRPVRRGRLGRS